MLLQDCFNQSFIKLEVYCKGVHSEVVNPLDSNLLIKVQILVAAPRLLSFE
jgi:hypothetical protein